MCNIEKMRCLIVSLTTIIIVVDFTNAELPANFKNDDYFPYGPQVDIPTDVVFEGGWNECFVSNLLHTALLAFEWRIGGYRCEDDRYLNDSSE